jgi:hypothetical protein
VDVYSYDEQRRLAVVQVRQCIFRPGRFNKVRKDYYLVGTNENGNAFAHPVETVARSKTAMATASGGVALALSRIWDCPVDDLHAIRRNGDVAFVPLGRLPADAVEVGENGLTFADSHVVTAEHIYRTPDGTHYVKGRAWLRHEKGQHKAVQCSGVYRVQVGVRAKTWGFTAPTAD